jgi:hypothetical protein
MAEETKKTFTIRLPEQIVARVGAQASGLNVPPTTLLQSVLVRHFDAAGAGAHDTAPIAALGRNLEALRKLCDRLEQAAADRYAQLLFEMVKTRSAIFHSLDQSMGTNAVDEIIEASEQTARQYLARLDNAPEAKQ